MDENLIEVMKVIDSLGINDYIMLIGSWSELIYEKNGIIEDFTSNIKTQDIDFLVENIHQPRENVSVLLAFEKAGFEIEVTGFDIYKIIKNNFEVEFLARQVGGNYHSIGLPSFDIPKVEALSHVSMLFVDAIQTEYKGISLTIPNPFNYVLHKMAINKKRRGKKIKDQEAINNLVISLDDEDTFLKYYDQLSKNEKKEVRAYITEHGLEPFFDSSMKIYVENDF